MFIIVFSLNIHFHSASFVSVITLFNVCILAGFVVLYCRFYFMYYLLICFCRFYCLLLFLPSSLQSWCHSTHRLGCWLSVSFVRGCIVSISCHTNQCSIDFIFTKKFLLTASFIYFPRFTPFSRYLLFHFNSSTHQYLDLRFTIK